MRALNEECENEPIRSELSRRRRTEAIFAFYSLLQHIVSCISRDFFTNFRDLSCILVIFDYFLLYEGESRLN